VFGEEDLIITPPPSSSTLINRGLKLAEAGVDTFV
jgi:hypothetical protein